MKVWVVNTTWRTDDDVDLDVTESNVEYCTGDYDYFELNLSEENVND